jgi:DNA polymerase-4
MGEIAVVNRIGTGVRIFKRLKPNVKKLGGIIICGLAKARLTPMTGHQAYRPIQPYNLQIQTIENDAFLSMCPENGDIKCRISPPYGSDVLWTQVSLEPAMGRTILHLDLDAFFCAVEEQRDPSLRGQPFAVGGRPEERGVVASCSYAARRYGVRSAMPMAQAIKRCPQLIIVPRQGNAYQAMSRRVMAYLHQMTPLVEQLSIDEAFLDVSDLPHDGQTLARQLQQAINRELGLSCSLGVASNKLVAKIANTVGKAAVRGDGPPNAIQVVRPGQEAAFLAPLPVEELWGVGPKTAAQLEQLGIRTMGDLAARSEADLAQRFGKQGYELVRRARGIDERPIETVRETKSVSQETTFIHDVSDAAKLKRTLLELAEGVGKQLRQSGLKGSTVKLKLRWSDFTTLTRQLTLDGYTNMDIDLYSAAVQLFEKAWPVGQAVRLIGVGISSFEPAERQLDLWQDAPPEESEQLHNALESLRSKFKDSVVQRGIKVKRAADK